MITGGAIEACAVVVHMLDKRWRIAKLRPAAAHSPRDGAILVDVVVALFGSLYCGGRLNREGSLAREVVMLCGDA